jgi:hypothetical protein
MEVSLRSSAHIEAAKSEALKLGATIELEHRSKHICGIIKINGKERKIFLSLTPRDNKVCYVVREDVRRKVKEMMECHI